LHPRLLHLEYRPSAPGSGIRKIVHPTEGRRGKGEARKVRTGVWLLALLLPLASAAARSGETNYPPDIRKILDRKKLIVALPKVDQPPFFWYDKKAKKLKGFDIELAEQVAIRLGLGSGAVEYNREAPTFNKVADLVHARKVDVAICKLSATLSRGRKLLFTEPYVVLRKGLLINRLKFARLKRGRDPAAAIRKFRGRVAVIAGSSYEGYAREMFLKDKDDDAEARKRIAPKKDWAAVVGAVESGEVDAAFRDELEIKKIFRQRPDVAIRLQSVVFKDTRDPIAMAVPWESTHLHKWLQQFLRKHFSEYLRSKKRHITADELLDRYPEIFAGKEPAEKKKSAAPVAAKPAPGEKMP
jgi:ABC-type amino acid transport substrate-binding protein